MGEWKLALNQEEILEKYKMLKSNSRKVLTNFPLYTEDINVAIHNTEVFYCCDNTSIVVLKREDKYYRLFYFLAGEDGFKWFFPPSAAGGIIICEIIEKEQKEKQLAVVNGLLDEGFQIYKKYYKWELDISNVEQERHRSTREIKSAEILDLLSDLFDIYSDHVPGFRERSDYTAERNGIVLQENNCIVGGVLFRKRDSVAEEDFIFTVGSGRGRGLSKVLEADFLSICKADNIIRKAVAWIEENNRESIALHDRFGYICTNQYKLTLRKCDEKMQI